MSRISSGRLEKYRKLADKDLWDINDEQFRAFYARAAAEGVELVSNNFSTLGMFRAPHSKDLDGVEVRDIIRGVRGMDIVGGDLMELSPPNDPTGKSACLASGIAFAMLCLLAECRAERTGRARPTRWKR